MIGSGSKASKKLCRIYPALARAHEVRALEESEVLAALRGGLPDVESEVPTSTNPRSLEDSVRVTKSKAKVSKLVLNREGPDDVDELLMELDAKSSKKGEFLAHLRHWDVMR